MDGEVKMVTAKEINDQDRKNALIGKLKTDLRRNCHQQDDFIMLFTQREIQQIYYFLTDGEEQAEEGDNN